MSKFAIGTRHPSARDGDVEVIGRNGNRLRVRFINTGTIRELSYGSVRDGMFRDTNRDLHIPSAGQRLTDPSIISYSRVSSNRQVSGTGLSQQRDLAVLEELSHKYSLPIDARSFSDEGASAYKGDHLQGEFGKLLALIESGAIITGSILAITSLDRLSRAKTNEAMELMLSVINRGVRIYTAMDDKLYSSDSPNLTADLIVSVIIMAQAHEESLKKSKRTIGNAMALITEHQAGHRNDDGMAKAIRSVASLPWWTTVKDGYIYLNEPVAEVVRAIIHKSISGWGMHRIMNWLNEDVSVRPPNSEHWDYGIVSRLHNRKSLFGEYSLTLNGTEHRLQDYVPPVVDERTYWQFVEAKRSRSHSRSTTQTNSFMTGINKLKCRHCGSAMSGTVKGGKLRFYCITGSRQKHLCDGVNVTAEPIELAVLDNLSFLSMIPSDSTGNDSATSKLALTDAEEKLSQMTEAFMVSPSATLAGLMATLEVEVSQKRVEYEQTMQQPNNDWVMTSVPSDVDERRSVLRRSMQSIQVFKVKKFCYLISMYPHRCEPIHIYMVRGKVVKVGGFYMDLSREDELLADRGKFSLFMVDGSFDAWLSMSDQLDFIEHNLDTVNHS